MRRTCRRLLSLVMIAVILCGTMSISWQAGSVRASQVTEENEITSDKMTNPDGQEDTKDKEDKEERKEQEKNTGEEEAEDKKTDSTQDTEEASTEAKEDASEEKTEETDLPEETMPSTEDQVNETTEEEANDEEIDIEDTEEVSLYSTLGPHDVDMPDVTSHYFTLQKNSKKVSEASGSNLKVVGDVKGAAQYIFHEMKDGNLYSFTPRMTSQSTVTVGGGKSGGVSLSTIKSSNRNRFGDLYDKTNSASIQTQAYNLEKCTTNPYAIYTNVGTWYDSSSRKTYAVDMKLTVTGYLFPDKKIRDQLNNQYTAPYVGFYNKKIGIVAMGTDYVQTQMTFYYHGSQTEISNLRGVIQFCDIDSQQGVDFGSGFQKIVMFKTSGSHLQYNSSGVIGNSKGYVSSRTIENVSQGDSRTTVLGIFSGSRVSCRWTIAKCDHKDTGGSAAYAAKSGYGIPADSSQEDSRSYYYSNSTGFLGIYADLGLIPIPTETEKNEYAGKVDGSKSSIDQKELKLENRSSEMTFVLSAAAASPSDLSKAQYTAFCFQDNFEAAFHINKEGIRVFTEKSLETSTAYADVTNRFQIQLESKEDHRTYVEVNANSSELKKSDFYGRTYYVHIPVRIRTEEEMNSMGISLKNWYQNDNKLGEKINSSILYRGMVAIGNQSQLYVVTNQGTSASLTSRENLVRIPMRVVLRKYGSTDQKPVEGVKFGLFAGSAEDYTEDQKPLLTAESDEQGYVCFEADTFYTNDDGKGPYHIREIGIPEAYKNVWSPSIQKDWSYIIEDLSDPTLYEKKESLFQLLDGSHEDHKNQILINTPYENPKHKVCVYKLSQDTQEILTGAEFALYQWSEASKDYIHLMDLKEGLDDKGKSCYRNEEAFKNTVDNLGRYKVIEKKAPLGCTISDQEWIFESNEETTELSKNFENGLQKGKITILKSGEDEKALEGVKFQVKAAEDIYPPWVEKEEDRNEKNLLVAKDTLVDTMVTDEAGRAQTEKGHELYIGTYIIEEIAGAKGYLLDGTPRNLVMKYSDKEENILEYTLPIKNELMNPSMAVSKLAERTRNAMGQEVGKNQITGRYTDKKIPGTYQAEETVDYTITVTNTGNVTLHNLKLVDTMDQINEDSGYKLTDFVEDKSAHFIIPKEGYYVSAKGVKVSPLPERSSDTELVLDQLLSGDYVEVHFQIKIKEKTANVFMLRNDVVLSAEYEDQQGEDVKAERKEVPTKELVDDEGNSLVRDWDYINVPGTAKPRVAKLADRTTGAKMSQGRYEGKKMEGSYEYGEDVDFTITVTNYGTADLYQILVEDSLDAKLLQSLEEKSIRFEEGTYITSYGEEVHAVAREEKTPGKVSLLLDYLKAGDSLELHLTARVKSGVAAGKALKNHVEITAEYQTGEDKFESVEKTQEMEDDDTIGIAVPSLVIAKLADKTTGVTMKDGRYTGSKTSGSYEAGDLILYTITITNVGNGTAREMTIKEEPSKNLLKYVTITGFRNKEGDVIASKQGNKVVVKMAETNKLTLDQLQPGDSVEVIYEAKVNQKIEKAGNLDNLVRVSGKNKDGSGIPETEFMKDSDKVKLKVKNEVWNRISHSGSNPQTGDLSHAQLYCVLFGLALAGVASLIYARRRIR